MQRELIFPIILIVGWSVLSSEIARAQDTDDCPAVDWANVPTHELKNIKFLPVDDAVVKHSHERRGFVSVPLNYDDPDGRQLRIFYRLMPDGRTEMDQANSLPILVVMNGGPGVPSSAYRALDYEYGGEKPEGAFAHLSQHFRILAVDQRGTGNSSPLDLDNPALSAPAIAKYFDSDEHAKDHARVVDAVVPGEEAFFVLARSYGGHIGFQHLALGDAVRRPTGYVFSSALLPHSDALETFIRRREKQKELNLSLKATHPHVVVKLERVRTHFQALGLDSNAVNYLWEYLGKNGNWETALEQKIDEYLAIDSRIEVESKLGAGIQQSVNLLNYVLASSALTPGYTDRTIAEEIRRQVPFEQWMLDETWTLVQIGNDGSWREQFSCSVDRNPPPRSKFQAIDDIRAGLAATHVLFTFGTSDAFLPHELQVNSAKRFDVPGRTEFHVFVGGHGAAFSKDGAEVVGRWAIKLRAETPL